MNIGMLAMQKQFDVLERFVDDFQSINMRIEPLKFQLLWLLKGMFLEVDAKFQCIERRNLCS